MIIVNWERKERTAHYKPNSFKEKSQRKWKLKMKINKMNMCSDLIAPDKKIARFVASVIGKKVLILLFQMEK